MSQTADSATVTENFDVLERMLAEIQRRRSADVSEEVRPGRPQRFTEASTPGDMIAQGDFFLMVLPPGAHETLGDDYRELTSPSERRPNEDFQLVIGNTEGARHALQADPEVRIWVPKVWNEDSLVGPIFLVGPNKPAVVPHPVHGPVTAPQNFLICTSYEQEYDKQLKAERRARD